MPCRTCCSWPSSTGCPCYALPFRMPSPCTAAASSGAMETLSWVRNWLPRSTRPGKIVFVGFVHPHFSNKQVTLLQVVLAWTGTDGCLLAPPSAASTEDVLDLEEDLLSLLQALRQSRLSAGLSLMDSQPLGHCTDRYTQHRLHLQRIYGHVWGENQLEGQRRSAKADAASLRQTGACHTTITADPFHDSLSLRRVCPARLPDGRALLADHLDALGRLSAPDAPPSSASQSQPVQELPRPLHSLLAAVVAERAENWKTLRLLLLLLHFVACRRSGRVDLNTELSSSEDNQRRQR